MKVEGDPQTCPRSYFITLFTARRKLTYLPTYTPTTSQLLAALGDASGPSLAHFLGLFTEGSWLGPPADVVQAVVRSPIQFLGAAPLPATAVSPGRIGGGAAAITTTASAAMTRTWRVTIEDRRNGLNGVGTGHHPHGPGFIIGALQAFAANGTLGIRSVMPVDDEEYIGSSANLQQVRPSSSWSQASP